MTDAAQEADQDTPQETASTTAVVDYIKSRIRGGYLVPGQRLVEADLMRETNASRGRVREALQRLVVEGIVVQQEFRGASVKRLTRDEVDQNYRAREMLEALCARLVAERGEPDVLRRLGELQAAMDVCEAEGDNDRYGTLNEEWHELIIAGSRNVYTQTFLERLRIPIFRIQFRRMFSRRALLSSNTAHKKITAAIVAGDAEAAELLMRSHIREALDDFTNSADELFGP